MSPGVRMYVSAVAPSIGAHAPALASQRCHWNEYDVGDPLHVPVVALSVEPTIVVPETCGDAVTAGTVAPPAAATGAVGAEDAVAARDFDVAVTVAAILCPTSLTDGV
jgi:hypothetical protein